MEDKMATTKAGAPTLVIASKAKEYIKGTSDVRVGRELLEFLNADLAHTIDKAIARCEGNGRKTLRPEDI